MAHWSGLPYSVDDRIVRPMVRFYQPSRTAITKSGEGPSRFFAIPVAGSVIVREGSGILSSLVAHRTGTMKASLYAPSHADPVPAIRCI